MAMMSRNRKSNPQAWLVALNAPSRSSELAWVPVSVIDNLPASQRVCLDGRGSGSGSGSGAAPGTKAIVAYCAPDNCE